MQFHVLTLFPNLFQSFLTESLLKKAITRKLLKINIINIRDYTTDPHQTADDRPYGGGPGMVLKPEPIALALDDLISQSPKRPLIVALSPAGKTFTQTFAREFQRHNSIVLICGRYEGIDQRVMDLYCDLELSIGDYVLNGGEVPAMVVIEAVARLIPGFVGEKDSHEVESFSDGLLEHPHYTRPMEFKGLKVPEVLLNGNHKEIELFRKEQALLKTKKQRPELLDPK